MYICICMYIVLHYIYIYIDIHIYIYIDIAYIHRAYVEYILSTLVFLSSRTTLHATL
jgi:hypothetical protein